MIAALCLFLALRLSVLFTSSRMLFYWEETAPLVVAEQLLAGPRLPLLEYEASDYQGGPLVVAPLAVPLVWLFGASIPAFKLVPLGFAAGTLVVFYGLGTHPETALFSAIVVACMAKAEPTASPSLSAVMGFVGGFGLWFDYVTGLALAIVLPLDVALGR